MQRVWLLRQSNSEPRDNTPVHEDHIAAMWQTFPEALLFFRCVFSCWLSRWKRQGLITVVLMTFCDGGRSVLSTGGFRCRLFLSEYEYWVFSEVALWSCWDCPAVGRQDTEMRRRLCFRRTIAKEVLWTLERDAGLSVRGPGRHCMSWNCT